MSVKKNENHLKYRWKFGKKMEENLSPFELELLVNKRRKISKM